ncbi:TPA: DUF669 domain-containing protein [Legionella anisa]|uniref:DUF669 domain-containing protein n=1 Tax=Legionella anisa TaxID=28082 RepID=UPI0022438C28|nr:DUF669 domain-containing protein [Legionella anisa]MCW8425595.1 DUF669 domain-containing protein [Legionella anisa]MCW8448975.1 DUF669 domain-containing protein [Legionella anisa]
MFSYQVMNEQEAMQERFQLLKEGEYDAVITASQDTHSSTGNPMMDMTVTVFDENGRKQDIRDFLVFTPKMMWKIIHFADSAGILKEYEEQKLCSQVAIDNRVRVKIKIEEGKLIPVEKLDGKPMGSKYPDKNKVEDYVKREDWKPLGHAPNAMKFEDDDVPFL